MSQETTQPPTLEEPVESTEIGAGPATSEMFAEVDHDFGNIVHRMYYWSEVLEDKTGADPDGSEAVTELRDALGELHRLLGRVMEFFKPVEMHMFSLSVEDLVARVSRRLGCTDVEGADSPAVRALSAHEIEVDPMQLDRAVDMVCEALVATESSPASPAVRAVRVDAISKDGKRGILMRLSAQPNGDSPSALTHVTRNLVSRILGCMNWRLSFSDKQDERSCDLFVTVD